MADPSRCLARLCPSSVTGSYPKANTYLHAARRYNPSPGSHRQTSTLNNLTSKVASRPSLVDRQSPVRPRCQVKTGDDHAHKAPAVISTLTCLTCHLGQGADRASTQQSSPPLQRCSCATSNATRRDAPTHHPPSSPPPRKHTRSLHSLVHRLAYLSIHTRTWGTDSTYLPTH